MEFALIRHTRCDIAAGTCYGHLDVPLASTAAADIELTLSRVPPVDVIFSSPSQRCHSLAQALAARDACQIHVRRELRELNFGLWEGRRWNDIPRALSDAWAEDPWNGAPPGGESESQLWQRVARMAEELLQLAGLKRAAEDAKPATVAESITAAKPVTAAEPITAPKLIAVAKPATVAESITAANPFAAEPTIVAKSSTVNPKRIAIVSHGGPLGHLPCLLTGTPASERWCWRIECGEVALIAPRESACPSSGP